MPDIAARTSAVREHTGAAPWPGYEYVRGWGVFGLPFDSGHVLALRVFPEGSFGPYRTVWHRDPAGKWSIFVDGPRPDLACPRYYGAACAHIGQGRIDLSWTDARTLHVTLDTPSLDWTLSMQAPPVLNVLNGVSAAMPLATWRPEPLLRLRERLARALGMGRLSLSGIMPSGHVGTLMPQRMYFVNQARANLGGVDLGRPVKLAANPTIGSVSLAARGVLAIGQAMWQIHDADEFNRNRTEVRAAETG